MESKRLDAEELELLVRSLREFGDREVPLSRRSAWDRTDTCPPAVVRALVRQVGLHLMTPPGEAGGIAASARQVCRLSQELAEIDLGLATSVLAATHGTGVIRVGCTEQQRAKWAPRIADEGLIVACGMTEPEAGSNIENIGTLAERITDSSGLVTHYRLNGVKQFITNGSIADVFVFLAKAPGGPSFFVVDSMTPGLTAGRREVKHGVRLSDTSQVLLQDVLIPAEDIVGAREGEGLAQASEVSELTRLMAAALGIGAGVASLNRAIAYSRQRRQFGTRLAEKQGYTHKLLVPNSVRLAAARAYIEYVADEIDGGGSGRHAAASIAKLFATEAGNEAADDAVQALGGYGYCVDFEVEKLRRDAKALTIFEGTSEIQKMIISAFRVRDSIRGDGAFYRRMADAVEPLVDSGGPAAARAARFLADATQTAFRASLFRKQHVAFEFAVAMADVETALALARDAASHAHKLLSAQARLWTSHVSLSVPVRLLSVLAASNGITGPELSRLQALGDLDTAIALQAGRLSDMDLVAKIITGLDECSQPT